MALWPLLGIWKAQVGPTCRGAAAQHGVGTGPRQEQARLRLPALLSLGSSKQKPLAPGSPCPTALTNALNVVTKAPAVPPAAFTPRNNQVSRLIAAAGRSQYSEQLLSWAFLPGNLAVPIPPSASGLCLPVTSAQAPRITPRPALCGCVSWVVPILLPLKLVGSNGVDSQASAPSRVMAMGGNLALSPTLLGDLCEGAPASSWFSFISGSWRPSWWNRNNNWASWGLKGTCVKQGANHHVVWKRLVHPLYFRNALLTAPPDHRAMGFSSLALP